MRHRAILYNTQMVERNNGQAYAPVVNGHMKKTICFGINRVSPMRDGEETRPVGPWRRDKRRCALPSRWSRRLQVGHMSQHHVILAA
jgi:hypothetical protein